MMTLENDKGDEINIILHDDVSEYEKGNITKYAVTVPMALCSKKWQAEMLQHDLNVFIMEASSKILNESEEPRYEQETSERTKDKGD